MFFLLFFLTIEGSGSGAWSGNPDPYLSLMDPDQGGQKHVDPSPSDPDLHYCYGQYLNYLLELLENKKITGIAVPQNLKHRRFTAATTVWKPLRTLWWSWLKMLGGTVPDGQVRNDGAAIEELGPHIVHHNCLSDKKKEILFQNTRDF